VYAVRHRGLGRHARDLAAVLTCGDDAVLSHQSAAGLWGLRPPWGGLVRVLTPGDRRRPGVVVHRARRLLPRDVTVPDRIPVTTPARTLLDLSGVLGPAHLERAVNEAEVLRLTSRGEIAALLYHSPGRGGALSALLRRDADAPTRSHLEDRFLAFLTGQNLPAPLVNQRIHGYEVDFHWPEANPVVELDGFAFHSTRTPFERDRARDAALQAAGQRVVRVAHPRLAYDTDATAAMLEMLSRPAPPRAA
jgi:very-short-patch-repair endonuclease